MNGNVNQSDVPLTRAFIPLARAIGLVIRLIINFISDFSEIDSVTYLLSLVNKVQTIPMRIFMRAGLSSINHCKCGIKVEKPECLPVVVNICSS